MATAELVQLTVVFRTIDMFIFHLMYHIKIYIATRPRYMRTRPMLHEAEAEAKTYEAEATKFGLDAVLASKT